MQTCRRILSLGISALRISPAPGRSTGGRRLLASTTRRLTTKTHLVHDSIEAAVLTIALTALHAVGGGNETPVVRPGAPFVHSIAEVNDPLSHGVVGDSLLSINEAIQLHNRTLLTSQLSVAEQNQLSGAGADIAWINIDASSVPTVTVERDFDVIQDWPHGFLLQGFNGDAEIDFTGPGLQHGFRATSNFASWRNLILRGGPRGIELQQTDASFGGTVLDHVTFVGQSVAGFVGSGLSANGYGRVLFTRCTFSNVPSAATWDESPSGRTSVFVVADTITSGVTNGFDVLLGQGGAAVLQFERDSVEATGAAIVARRTAGGDRAVMASFVHVQTRGGSGVSLAGDASASTSVDVRGLDLVSQTSALALGSVGAGVSGLIEDSRVVGGVGLHASVAGPLDANNLYVGGGGTLTVSSGGAAMRVRRSRMVGVGVGTAGGVGIAIEDSSIEGGSVQGSASAALALTRCHVTGLIGANTTSSAPVASVQIGQLTVTPFVATTGGSIQIASEMPAGFVGLYVLGFTSSTPLFLAPELHVYLDLATAVTLPGITIGQQTASLQIPNDPAFWDTDWVAQAAVLAPAGVAPAVHTPPPQRFVIRQ